MNQEPIGSMNPRQTERMTVFTILITFCSSVFAVAVWGLVSQQLPSVIASVIFLVPGLSGAVAWIITKVYIPKLNAKWETIG